MKEGWEGMLVFGRKNGFNVCGKGLRKKNCD